MSERRLRQAVQDFAGPLQRSLTAFANGKLTVGFVRADVPTTLVFNDVTRPTTLRTEYGAASVAVSVSLSVLPTSNSVTTLSWAHRVFVDSVERLFFHWHPSETPRIPFPHVHIDGGKPHIPTGRVLVEDVLLAAMEFGALPIASDWKDKLRSSVEVFQTSATWGTRAPMREDWLSRWDHQGRVES